MTLSEDEYKCIVEEPCFYCQNKLSTKITGGSGLDRLDSSLGYTTDNCVSCCCFCNSIKNDLLTVSEMQKVAQLLIEERIGTEPVNVHQMRNALQ